MQNINRVIITGHITKDPDLRATPSGIDVLSFSIAVNDSRKNKQTGQWEDYANFIDCTMFGNRANALSKVLEKGALICVEGKLHYSSWERDGLKRSKVEISVDQVEVMRRRAVQESTQSATQETWEPPTSIDQYEDIPF